MKIISSAADEFKRSNPVADDSEIAIHLKNLGYSQSEIDHHFISVNELKQENSDFDIHECTAEAIPDLDKTFDLPDDIVEELKKLK